MKHQRAKDFAFGLSAICSVVLIGAAILGVFLTTETFVTRYSVFAGRSPYIMGR